MKQKRFRDLKWITALLIIVAAGSYYQISYEYNYWLHGRLVFAPLIQLFIASIGYLVLYKHSIKSLLQVWILLYEFAVLLSLVIGLLCRAGFQAYVPYIGVSLIINFSISPLPFATLYIIHKKYLKISSKCKIQADAVNMGDEGTK